MQLIDKDSHLRVIYGLINYYYIIQIQIPVEKKREKEKGREEHLASIDVSKKSTPTFIAVAELNN